MFLRKVSESVLPRPVYTYGLVYEVQDLCLNLDGIQPIVPADYTLGAGGNCSPAADICSNLAGVQIVMPNGYKAGGVGECLLDLPPIKITELLPNPQGTDANNEFIELFNPNDIAIDLGLYRLKTGIETQKTYAFPAGSSIPPNSYITFYNSVIPFTLTNTVSKVQITAADDILVDESLSYSDAKDNMAWALIEGEWQYTNQPTPGSANKASLIESLDEIVSTNTLKPCASNQYRNPETNRCNLIETNVAVLKPCEVGQYRSAETSRCRNLGSDAGALEPCAANQERNPATNRCRLISSASADAGLVACKEGQERNPTTNRCRNIVKLSAAAYPVETFADNSNGPASWLAFGAIGSLAVVYGVWEWRVEIIRILRKARSFIHFNKKPILRP